MKNYFGIPFEIKVTYPNGDSYELSVEDLLINDSTDWSTDGLKLQQFTGILDRNGDKIYFGNTLRFADKWEWYRGEWYWKLFGTKGEERKKLKEEYNNLPYEERVIEGVLDYEWLLSSEIQSYWELVKI